MQKKIKLYERVICIIVSLFILYVSVLPCYLAVSADETTSAVTESTPQNDYSDFFYDSYNYDQGFYDLYDYYVNHSDFVSNDISFDDFTGFCFKTQFFDDYTTYFFVGVPSGLNEHCLFASSDSGNGIYNFSFATSASGKYEVAYMYMRVYTNGNSNSYFQTTNYLTGLNSLYSILNDHEHLIYDSNEHRIFSISSPGSSDNVKYNFGSEQTFNYTCFPVGKGWKNTFSKLTFTVSPSFSENMSMTSLPDCFTIDVDNPTSKTYNYMIFVSDKPSSSNLKGSYNSLKYCLSSQQWCMLYRSQSAAMSNGALFDNVADWYVDSFGRSVIDSFGQIIDIGKTYVTSQGDNYYYYTLSQTKCPYYCVSPQQTVGVQWSGQNLSHRTHEISFSQLGLKQDETYYLNIIYFDISNVNFQSVTNSSHTEFLAHPIYNNDLLSSYSTYSSTAFSFSNGTFVNSNDNMYSYRDVVSNSDPSKCTALMSSDDNSVSINTDNSNTNTSNANKFNYGNIYNGNVYTYYTYDSHSEDNHHDNNNYYYGTSNDPIDLVTDDRDGSGLLDTVVNGLNDLLNNIFDLADGVPDALIDELGDFLNDTVSSGLKDLLPSIINGVCSLINTFFADHPDYNITVPDDLGDDITVYFNNDAVRDKLNTAHNHVLTRLSSSHIGIVNNGTINNGYGTGTDITLPNTQFDLSQLQDSVSNYKSFCSNAFDCLPSEVWSLICLALSSTIILIFLKR